MNNKEHIQQLRDRINYNGSIEHDILMLANAITRLANNIKTMPEGELELITSDMKKLAKRYRGFNNENN